MTNEYEPDQRDIAQRLSTLLNLDLAVDRNAVEPPSLSHPGVYLLQRHDFDQERYDTAVGVIEIEMRMYDKNLRNRRAFQDDGDNTAMDQLLEDLDRKDRLREQNPERTMAVGRFISSLESHRGSFVRVVAYNNKLALVIDAEALERPEQIELLESHIDEQSLQCWAETNKDMNTDPSNLSTEERGEWVTRMLRGPSQRDLDLEDLFDQPDDPTVSK